MQSITIVLKDGTIWTADMSVFTEVTPPVMDNVIEVDVRTESGAETKFVPESPETVA